MDRTSKSFALILILVMAISILSLLLLAKPVFAQSIPKPSVPEFTATIISSPADSHFVNKTIELSIKNQPAVSNNGFFYNVRIRINDGNWSLLYPIDDVPSQSSGEYTNLSYPSDQPVVEYQYNLGDSIHNLFAGDTVDFQVQAMIGSIHRTSNPNATNQIEMYPYIFTGEMSNWSSAQTIIMPATSALSPTPTVPEFPTLAILSLLIAMFSFAVMFRRKFPEDRARFGYNE